LALELIQLRPKPLDPLLQAFLALAAAFIEARSVTPLLAIRIQRASGTLATLHALLLPHATLAGIGLLRELAALSSPRIPRRAELTALPLHVELAHALAAVRCTAEARAASHSESITPTELGTRTELRVLAELRPRTELRTRAELLTATPKPHAAHRGAHPPLAKRAFATATAPHRRATPGTSAALSLHAPTLPCTGERSLATGHRTGPTLAESGSAASSAWAHPTPERLLVIRPLRPGRTEP
jgi:hypothetical protein